MKEEEEKWQALNAISEPPNAVPDDFVCTIVV